MLSYNGQVLPDIRELVIRTNPVQGKSYLVYGVGDHGGGPTRRDIVNGLFYKTIPRFPQINFGSAGEFFSSLQTDNPKFPVVKGELQYIFPGCYTSIAQIKALNRRCENSLFSAEVLSALLSAIGYQYPKDELRKAWEIVTFNQFHDILCGSGNAPSNREAIGAYDHSLLQAERACDNALRALSASLPTLENNGQPVVVFNPLPFARSEVVNADIFCYDMPPAVSINNWSENGPPDLVQSPQFVTRDMGQGLFPTIRLCDADGKLHEAQIIGARHFPQGFRLKVSFIAAQIPPCGWQLYYADTTRAMKPLSNSLQVQGTTVNTDYLSVTVDKKTGSSDAYL